MPRVVVLPSADQDLDEQAFYLLAHGSPETAARWYDQAAVTFAFLADHPDIGATWESLRETRRPPPNRDFARAPTVVVMVDHP